MTLKYIKPGFWLKFSTLKFKDTTINYYTVVQKVFQYFAYLRKTLNISENRMSLHKHQGKKEILINSIAI